MPSIDIDRRLSRREAADFLTLRGFRIAAATLAKYASLGGGPDAARNRRSVENLIVTGALARLKAGTLDPNVVVALLAAVEVLE